MVVLWMCYATLVTALLTAGAWAADGALAAFGRPRRWAWAAAVAGGLALPLWAAWHPAAPAPAAPVTYVMTAPAIASPLAAASAAAPPTGAEQRMASWRVTLAAPSRAARTVDAVTRVLGELNGAMLLSWLLASAAGLAYVARGTWLVRRGRRGWRSTMVAGEQVWITADVGPALVGALRPRIVLPAWVVEGLDADALRLVLAHERAHAAAGDPLLLAATVGALVLAPWNAALWVAARRLRLATEADCDRRVLRAHPGARRYARLLVDVAERTLGGGRGRGAGVLAAALLDPPGLLERRVGWLLGAERTAGGGRPATRMAGVALGAATVVLACAVPRPTTAVAPVTTVRVSADLGPALSRAERRLDVAERLLGATDTVMHHAQSPVDLYARLKVIYGEAERAEADTTALSHDLQRRPSVARPDTVGTTGATIDSSSRRGSWPMLVVRPGRADTGVDTLMARVSAAADALKRDPRTRAQFDSAVDALRRALDPPPRRPVLPFVPGLASDTSGFPTQAAIRALVTQHFPQALTGGMGPKPFVWFALDARGRVLKTATGPTGLIVAPRNVLYGFRYDPDRYPRVTADSVPPGQQLVLDPKAAQLKFPGLLPERAVGVTWTHVDAGRDSVQVIIAAPSAPQ